MRRQRISELWLSGRLALITGVQVAGSVGIQWYIVSRFGANTAVDALFAGGTLFQLFRALLLDTLRAVITPMLTELHGEALRSATWKFLCVALAITVVPGAIAYAAAPLIVPALVPGFSESGKDLTIVLARIQMFTLAGSAVYSVLAANCIVRQRFVLPSAATMVGALTCCSLLFAGRFSYTIEDMAWVTVLFFAIPGLILLPCAGRPVGLLREWKALTAVWKQWRALIIGRGYFLASAPVDRLLLSYLPPGSLAIFEIAARICTVILNVLDVALLTPSVPRLSMLARSGDWLAFNRLTTRKAVESWGVSVVLLVFAFAGLSACRIAVDAGWVTAVFGKLGGADIAAIGLLILYMALLLPFTAITQVLSAAYFARRETPLWTKLSAVVHTFGIPVRVAGFAAGGLHGLVLAIGVTSSVYAWVLHRRLKRGSSDEPELLATSVGA